jgi:putative ABC transport system substrate-binding protein
VFIGIADAVGQGFIPSLTHPGGNLTGLTMYEASVSGKWLEMLKEIEPQVARAAFVLNPKTAPYYDFYMRGARSAAPSLGIEPVLTPIENDAADIERAMGSTGSTSLGKRLSMWTAFCAAPSLGNFQCRPRQSL